jgi:hypothetical protein
MQSGPNAGFGNRFRSRFRKVRQTRDNIREGAARKQALHGGAGHPAG